MPKIHSRYDLPPSNPVIFNDPSLAQQHFKNDADINTIMARYNKTGFLVDPLNPGTARPQYGDFADLTDYQTAQNIIAHSIQAFETLPAAMRKRFNNDPAEMLAFLENESNREEAVKLGLVDNSASDSDAPSDLSSGQVISKDGSPVAP